MPASSTIKVTADASQSLLSSVKALTKREVVIGIPGDGADRKPEKGEKSAPASNALIGYVQEFGDDEKAIPPRPFLYPGIEGAKADIVSQLKTTAERAVMGDKAIVDRGLTAVGIIGQNAVRAKITSGPFTPLSEKTLEARRRRGREGTSPLIDTGQLRQAITFAVRNKGDK